MNESDPRSNMHYLGSSENKAWKYILNRLFINWRVYLEPISQQLPVGLLAQLVEHCIGIAEVMGSNPGQARIFFSGLIFTTAQVVHITARITFIHNTNNVYQMIEFQGQTKVKSDQMTPNWRQTMIH